MSSKRYQALLELVDKTKRYGLREAVTLVKKTATAKFDETVEVAVKLGVNPKHSDQMIRGTVVLPHGTGKPVKVLVFAKGEKEREAQAAGADYVGAEDLIEKVSQGWTDFDIAIATPDMMKEVGKVGRVLKSKTPNPKAGTVTFDLARAVKESKAGRIEYRVDSYGIVHIPVGKASFDEEKLYENILSVLEVLVRARPASAKGQYLQSVTVSPTMGPGIKVDPIPIMNLFTK